MAVFDVMPIVPFVAAWLAEQMLASRTERNTRPIDSILGIGTVGRQ